MKMHAILLHPKTVLAELSEKFHQYAAWGGLDRDRTKAVLDLVWRVEELNDATELTSFLAWK